MEPVQQRRRRGRHRRGRGLPTDFYDDTVNTGCNASPPVFTDVAADGGLPRTYCGSTSTYRTTRTCDVDGDCPDMVCVGDPDPGDGVDEGLCVGPNEPSVHRRDTDWYRVSQPELAAADIDGNGTIRITSAVTGEAGLDLVTFFISIDNPLDCNPSVLVSLGCWDSTGGGGQTIASEAITISEHPAGIIVFVVLGSCNGAGIFDGVECSLEINDYTVSIATDPVFENGDFTACVDPAQNPLLRPCAEANPGVNGCEDPDCSAIVCEQAIPQCCTHELGWIQQCTDAAIDLGCAPQCFGACYPCLETGPDSSVDGYCRICTDGLGSWTSDSFGGGFPGNTISGDAYNPTGGAGPLPLDLQEASFTNGFYFFQRDGSGDGISRELLTNIVPWRQVFAPDDSVIRTGGEGSFVFDDDLNGSWDRFESTFNLTHPGVGPGLDLDIQLTQKLESNPGVATVLTQTLLITNVDVVSVDFTLVRSMDGDLVWDAAFDPTDDTVGAGGNGTSCRYVFQGETGLPKARTSRSFRPRPTRTSAPRRALTPTAPAPAPARRWRPAATARCGTPTACRARGRITSPASAPASTARAARRRRAARHHATRRSVCRSR